MEAVAERRGSRRFHMSLPLVVRFAGLEGSVQHRGSTRDVSFRGLYFLVDTQPEADASVEFVLTLPKEITMGEDFHIRCYGRVVRVEPQNPEHSRCGVAARIERYEIVNSPA